jgi:hypothetical protein
VRRALLLTCALALFATGCPLRPALPRIDNLTPETARLRLSKEGMRRARMGGHIKARMAGIEGLLASADLDVLVEQPARLHISVRSFFEQPMLTLATDGVYLTMLDATDEAGPVFRRGVVDGRAFSRVLPFEVWPAELVALFLGVAPVAGASARQLAIDEKAVTFSIGLKEPNGRSSVLTARLVDDALVRWRSWDPDGNELFDAEYGDFKEAGGVPFAHRITLTLPELDGSKRSVVFQAKEIEVNGAPYDPRAFALATPPGMTAQPLSE